MSAPLAAEQTQARKHITSDYHINVKAELEIELLHDKIDALREQEVLALTQAVHELTLLLKARGPMPETPAA